MQQGAAPNDPEDLIGLYRKPGSAPCRRVYLVMDSLASVEFDVAFNLTQGEEPEPGLEWVAFSPRRLIKAAGGPY